MRSPSTYLKENQKWLAKFVQNEVDLGEQIVRAK